MRRFVAHIGLAAALLLTGCSGDRNDDDRAGATQGAPTTGAPTAGAASQPGPAASASGASQPGAAAGPGAAAVPGAVPPAGQTPGPTRITVASAAFADGGPVPTRFTCRGQNLPPALTWTGVPAGTAALALVVDDPDAVGGVYVHWVVSDIPSATPGNAEGAAPPGGRVTTNSAGDRRYQGPCPPKGTGVHHYRFTLYALSKRVDLAGTTSAGKAVTAITAAATAQGRVVGTYAG